MSKGQYKNKTLLLRGSQSDFTGSVFDLPPPNDENIENIVLGSIMLNDQEFSQYIHGMNRDMFFKHENALVFDAIYSLFSKGDRIDIISVYRELKSLGLDIAFVDVFAGSYVSRLTNTQGCSTHDYFFKRELSELIGIYARRETLKNSSTLIRMCHDKRVTYEEVTTFLSDMTIFSGDTIFGDKTKKVGTHMKSFIDSLTAVMNKGSNIIGLDSGFNSVNFFMSGWREECHIVLAGRPGMGKTAFLLSSLLYMALNGIPVAMFSLEMSLRQLIVRLVSLLTGLSSTEIENPNHANYNTVFSCIALIESLPLYIDDETTDVNGIVASVKKLVTKHGVRAVGVDYLQLSSDSTNDGNREQEVSSISRKLKIASKSNRIPVISLSQLSRSVETRGGDKKPILADLRESGAIEQDADVVGFFYRAEYYGIDVDENGDPTTGTGTLIIAKNRHGSVGEAKMRFAGRVTEWFNIDGLPLREQRKHIESNETNDLELL